MLAKEFESVTDKRVWKKAMAHLKKSDAKLAKVITRYGMLEPGWGPSDPYEALVESFIYQQIAGNAADAILKKFKKLYHGKLPTPRQFLGTRQDVVRKAGISPQKYSYIKDLCERLVGDELDLKSLAKLPDEEVVAILDDVRGIGRWTAEMFLMFSLRRVDVFPVDDLGMQNGFRKVYGMSKAPDKEMMKRVSEKWKPYRTIAALYLWKSND